MEKTYPFVPYSKEPYSEEVMFQCSRGFYKWMDKRYTVREFSDRAVPMEVFENIIQSASTSPSGMHKQPWTFCM